MPVSPKHRKVLGELAEARFVAQAMAHGLRVAKPFGESAPYDFIVERKGRMRRVQLKSAAAMRADGVYHLRTSVGHRRPYTRGDTDFLVLYIFPREAWYVVPVGACRVMTVNVRCAGRGRLERYREAWELL